MKYYGQRETDRYIEDYFPEQVQGTAVEVGAYDGVKGSNTKMFEDKGWKTVCIEPNPDIFPLLQKNRPASHNVEGACAERPSFEPLEIFTFESGIESSLTSLKPDVRLIRDYGSAITNSREVDVNVFRLNDILEFLIIDSIDFVSIDTEGTELDVLKGFDLNKYCPRLLVVENNYEDPEIEEYLKDFGYVKDQRFFVNDFYVRK